MKHYIYLNNIKTSYYITEDAKVYNEKTNKELKGTVSINGYRKIQFSIDGKKIGKYLHRLMAIYFLGLNEDSELIVNHKDGNKLNNSLDNLEIITSGDNLIHAYSLGLKQPNSNKCILFEQDLPNEQWIRIKEYEDYEISTYGRVKSYKYKKPILLKQDIRSGYYSVVLSKNGITKHFMVHHLVFFSFNNIVLENNKVVDHIDGNKLNNKLENLRYVSISDNLNAALYEQKLNKSCRRILAIKDGVEKEFPSIAKASLKLGVDNSQISKVCRGKAKTAHGYSFKYLE